MACPKSGRMHRPASARHLCRVAAHAGQRSLKDMPQSHAEHLFKSSNQCIVTFESRRRHMEVSNRASIDNAPCEWSHVWSAPAAARTDLYLFEHVLANQFGIGDLFVIRL
jgi:hypothetical protein